MREKKRTRGCVSRQNKGVWTEQSEMPHRHTYLSGKSIKGLVTWYQLKLPQGIANSILVYQMNPFPEKKRRTEREDTIGPIIPLFISLQGSRSQNGQD